MKKMFDCQPTPFFSRSGWDLRCKMPIEWVFQNAHRKDVDWVQEIHDSPWWAINKTKLIRALSSSHWAFLVIQHP